MRYRVFVYSLPSPDWTPHAGHVDVDADNKDRASARALDELRRGPFCFRPRDSWKIVRVLPL